MNRQEIQKQINDLEKQQKEHNLKIAELKKQLEKPDWESLLVDTEVQHYLSIGSSDDSGHRVYTSQGWLKNRRYAFRTDQTDAANLMVEKIKLMQEMYAFASVKKKNPEVDWTDDRKKWGIRMNMNEPHIDDRYNFNGFVFGVTVDSQEAAQEMLEEFGERIRKYYNKQY